MNPTFSLVVPADVVETTRLDSDKKVVVFQTETPEGMVEVVEELRWLLDRVEARYRP